MWELRLLMRGYHRRHRPIYDANRMTAFIVSRLLGSKLQTPQELLPFSFERRIIEMRKEKERKENEELFELLKKEQMESMQC